MLHPNASLDGPEPVPPSRWQGETFILGFIFLFTLVNWFMLGLAEKLGPPDVYKLYGVAEKLFSGDFKIGIVPPLFPLIQYPLSKILGIMMGPMEAFVLAGRIISLPASLGVLWFSYRLLEKVVGKYAVMGLVFLVISPWYLKLLAFPITDMLYLFFTSAAFYSFLPGEKGEKKSWRFSVFAIGCGVLTRFEGVLLLLSGAINYFKLKKKYFYIMLAGIPVIAALMFFFFTFADRFFAHFRDIILARKSYLFMFNHPLEFLNVIYGNILFFIPYSFPGFIKWIFLLMVLVLFVYGAVRLYKKYARLTIALLVYEFFFLVAKGYIDTTRPEIEFRRIFSGLWIVYLLCFIGAFFFLQKIARHKWAGKVHFIVALISMPLFSFFLSPISLHLLPVLVLIVPVQWYCLKHLPSGKKIKYTALVVLLIFTVQIFNISYSQSRNYVMSMAPKAPYAAAQWLNHARIKPGATILSYTDNLMMGFYSDKKKLIKLGVKWETFTIPLHINRETKAHFIRAFFKEIDERNVDYIIFDNYVVQKDEFHDLNQAKRMLFEEKENKQLFRIKAPLQYKGKNVGYILKPVNAKANH